MAVNYYMVGAPIVAGLVIIAAWAFTRARANRATADAPPWGAKSGDPDESAASPASHEPLPTPKPSEAYRTRLKGDLHVGGHSDFQGGVLLQGSLLVEEDGVFDGGAEVQGDVVLGRRARITGPIIVRGNLTLHAAARVQGCRVDGEATLHGDAAVEGPIECDRLRIVAAPPTIMTLGQSLEATESAGRALESMSS